MARFLGIGALFISALVIYLFIEVRAEPGVDVDPDKLAEAKSRAERSQAARERSKPIARADSSARVKAPEPEPEPEIAAHARADDSPPIAVAGVSAGINITPPDLDGKPFVEKIKVARKLYGKRRYEQAYELALKLLEEEPNNRRVLRVVIASACVMAKPEEAESYYERLKMPRDRTQMRRRCKAYGVELSE